MSVSITSQQRTPLLVRYLLVRTLPSNHAPNAKRPNDTVCPRSAESEGRNLSMARGQPLPLTGQFWVCGTAVAFSFSALAFAGPLHPWLGGWMSCIRSVLVVCCFLDCDSVEADETILGTVSGRTLWLIVCLPASSLALPSILSFEFLDLFVSFDPATSISIQNVHVLAFLSFVA